MCVCVCVCVCECVCVRRAELRRSRSLIERWIKGLWCEGGRKRASERGRKGEREKRGRLPTVHACQLVLALPPDHDRATVLLALNVTKIKNPDGA